MPGEHFWLDVTDRDDRDKLLVVPRGVGKRSASSTHRLIRHVKGGEVVFHYDALQHAIVAWSISCGLREIARIQWSLFPSLRALRTRWGIPCYYPFEMGNREATRPFPGYVFKLPAVFVHGTPELADAAHRVARLLASYGTARSPLTLSAPSPLAALR